MDPPLCGPAFIRFIHPPTAPDSPLAAMQCGLKLGAIFDDAAVDGGVIDLHNPRSSMRAST